MPVRFRCVLPGLVLALLFPSTALAGVRAAQPFPTNLDTVPDATQLTGVRISLPSPDRGTAPSDCADVAVLDQLDGFSLQPRLSIPFSGPIDVSTVSSDTVFLADRAGDRIGVNQLVWEPLRDTLHAEPDRLLRQDTPYVLVVTDGVRAADGSRLDASRFRHDLNFGRTGDAASKAYRKELLDALHWSGVAPSDIVAASLFTT